MNLLKILFGSGYFNGKALLDMDTKNKYKLEELSEDIEIKTGAYVNPEILKIVATRYFIDCYNTEEVIQILDYFDFINPATRKTTQNTWSKHNETKNGKANE